jgi:hypothetical protein
MSARVGAGPLQTITWSRGRLASVITWPFREPHPAGDPAAVPLTGSGRSARLAAEVDGRYGRFFANDGREGFAGLAVYLIFVCD